MRRMLDGLKKVLRVAMLILIVGVPVWAQEEPAPEELGPDERRAQEVVLQVLESGEFANEEEAWGAVLSTLVAELGQDHAGVMGLTHVLALQFYKEGRYGKARQLFEQLVEVWTEIEGEDHPSTLRALNDLAGVLHAQGDYQKTVAIQRQIFGALSRILGDEHPDTLAAKVNLAVILKALGELAGARTREEEVLAARIRILGDEHLDTLTAKANLAVTLEAVGELAGARTRFEEVLGALSRILGDEHPQTLSVKANLAVTLKALGELADARTRFEEILDARIRILGDEHPDTLTAKVNLAGTLFALGELADARTRFEEVLDARIRILGDEHPDTLLVLHNVAVTYEAMDNLDQARSSYKKIIDSHRKSQGEDYLPVTESEAKTLLSLGRVNQATGQLADAQEAFVLALDAIEAQTEQLDLSEEKRRRYRASFQVGYHSALAVAVARRDIALALRLSERYRAGNLWTLLRPHRPGSLPDVPAEIEERLWSIAAEYDGITRTLDGLHPERNPTEYRRLVDRQIDLRRDREVIQSQWLREQLKDRDRNPPLDLQGIQRQLDPGTVLLVYNVGPDQTQLFVLSRDGDLLARPIDLGRTTLGQQVIRYHELLNPDDIKTSKPEARDKLGRWLFTKLVPPDERLESADRWLILADGPLHMLPFGALIRPEDVQGTWHYLAQHKPVHTVQSAAIYAELRSRRPAVTQVAGSRLESASWLGFGDPVYPSQISELDEKSETNDDRRVLRLGEERAIFDGLTELPNTEREIQSIGSLLPEMDVRIYLGAEATEERVWTDVAEARFVHFATHGVALPDEPETGMEPMDSFLALSLFDEAELKRRKLKHNGLLQAWEIIDLKLDADLVVLSACQTAIGEDRGGDGLISLSRAFQIAGARSVLASLWAVNDQSTAELMIRFYKHLLTGKSKDVALQEAQKELIAGPIEIVDEDGNVVPHDFSHPYHWAAFQLIGDWQ